MNPNLLFVESLESRIAPAILVNGGNLLGGKGNPATGETSSGGNTLTLIKVISGEALVFYDAANSQITGISVGKNTRLDITGDMSGDIVTNLLPDGRLTDSDNNPANGEDGGVLLPYKIKGITTHPLQLQNGDLGRIIAGGAISNINVSGSLQGIYAGDGIFRDGPTVSIDVGSIGGTVDYNTIAPGVQHIFTLTEVAAKSSSMASINNVAVHTADRLEIFAGGGSNNTGTTGGIGGSISNVTITTTLAGQGAKPALFLHAGDGGTGSSGGAGGGITNFDDLDSTAYVKVQTGDGGVAASGVGGMGGSLTNTMITTSSPRYDLLMGHGGSGVAGGNGGSISALTFNNNVLGGHSLIASGDFNNDGLQDVLLINTVTGEATLSLGSTATPNVPFVVALQPLTNADGSTGSTPFIAAAGAVPTGVIVTDLNGDSFLDFVVSYASTNNLGVFLNRGNATFSATSVALPASPTAISLGHFTGTATPSFAVLAGGDVASVNGGTNSQVFLAQDDAAGNLSVLSNPTLIQGVGTDIAAGDIDHLGGTDAFVGLKTGGLTPLFSTGAAFTAGTPFQAFGTSVDNIDVSGSTVLAFSKNTVTDPTSTAIIPGIVLVAFQPDGTGNAVQSFTPDASALRAHFVAGTGTIGVATPGAIELYQNNNGSYTSVANLSSDGNLNDFVATVTDGVYHVVATGAATNRFFYTDGTLDDTNGLPALKHANIPFEERIISFVAGDGGAGTAKSGGNGGGITGLTYIQKLGGGVIQAGGGYNTFVTTGNGGASVDANGGHGGNLASVALSLNPGYLNDGQDDTDYARILTGDGGDGAAGGAGGGITKTTSTTVFSTNADGSQRNGSVAVQLESGSGGVGTLTTGGVGGSITLAGPKSLGGVTFYDAESQTNEAPALSVEAGNGGAGVTAGGTGGSLTNVGAQNATNGNLVVNYNELGSAGIVAGNGGSATHGNGGNGGNVNAAYASVQSYGTLDGFIAVSGGNGGVSTDGHGGTGGSVVKSTVASASGDPSRNFGVLVNGGVGGDGSTGGGTGGGVKKLTVNTPSQTNLYAGLVAAGNGGDATISGTGGAGGNVKGISQTKDVNSAISAILGGSGGTSAAGTGGAGGSVKNINTVGFIGLPANDTDPLGVFDPGINSPDLQQFFADGKVTQGVYAGRGANGASNGSVHNVVARQIAAIGAVVDEQGLFGVAAAVTKINADLIGYEVIRDNVFESSVPGSVSPSAATPVDGFILAASVSGITTIDNTRTAAFTFNG